MLSGARGKIVLLHFFATFSQPSIRQIPQMRKLHRKYKKHGLVIYGITLEKDRDKLKEFARSKKLRYPILMDGRKVFKDYGLGQIPDLCFINGELVISAVYTGFSPDNGKKIEAEIGKLLADVSNKER